MNIQGILSQAGSSIYKTFQNNRVQIGKGLQHLFFGAVAVLSVAQATIILKGLFSNKQQPARRIIRNTKTPQGFQITRTKPQLLIGVDSKAPHESLKILKTRPLSLKQQQKAEVVLQNLEGLFLPIE